MKKTLDRIKNFISLHTSDLEDAMYIEMMRRLAEWAEDRADSTEYSEDNSLEIPDND